MNENSSVSNSYASDTMWGMPFYLLNIRSHKLTDLPKIKLQYSIVLRVFKFDPKLEFPIDLHLTSKFCTCETIRNIDSN